MANETEDPFCSSRGRRAGLPQFTTGPNFREGRRNPCMLQTAHLILPACLSHGPVTNSCPFRWRSAPGGLV